MKSDKSEKKINVFDLINDLQYKKEGIWDQEARKQYNAFLVNRAMAMFPDTVLLAEEMNQRWTLDPELQYRYYFHAVPPRKRWTKWLKKERGEDIELVRKYFNFSWRKAEAALRCLTNDDLDKMRSKMDVGGVQEPKEAISGMNRDEVNAIVDTLIEVRLKADFLVIKETLTRIGVCSFKNKSLYQSCHILHKKGKYYLCHFKQLFSLDGRDSDFSEEDQKRTNTIAALLDSWGLIEVIDKTKVESQLPREQVKVISAENKKNWNLIPKYKIGTIKSKKYYESSESF